MIQKKIRLTEEEARFISTKVTESGMTNFNAFARIMLIMGEVKILNFEELRELRKEINRIGAKTSERYRQSIYPKTGKSNKGTRAWL